MNWGYTASQAADGIDLEMVAAAAALLILIIMTGYLIIYNIFRISVSSDIRYYGLLKTVGVTPQQLRRIVRQQAMMLCAEGCPAGLVIGYLAGRVLMPVIMESTSLGNFVCGGEHITCDIRSICIVFHRDGISVMRQTGSDGVKSFSRRSCKVCRCFAWSA